MGLACIELVFGEWQRELVVRRGSWRGLEVNYYGIDKVRLGFPFC